MPSSYSEDFRQKVIAAVERGEGKTKVARMMNIALRIYVRTLLM
jgi:transposase-like protein